MLYDESHPVSSIPCFPCSSTPGGCCVDHRRKHSAQNWPQGDQGTCSTLPCDPTAADPVQPSTWLPSLTQPRELCQMTDLQKHCCRHPAANPELCLLTYYLLTLGDLGRRECQNPSTKSAQLLIGATVRIPRYPPGPSGSDSCQSTVHQARERAEDSEGRIEPSTVTLGSEVHSIHNL